MAAAPGPDNRLIPICPVAGAAAMNVKRYFAPTAREALRALKDELGGEAIVLANRAVEGGVEILALPPGALGHVQAVTPGPIHRPPAAAAEKDIPRRPPEVAPRSEERRVGKECR